MFASAFRFSALFVVLAAVATALKGSMPRALLRSTSSSSTALQATMIDTLKSAGCFTTLLKAIDAAGLQDALSGPGPMSLFAPGDDAFSGSMPPAELEALLKDKKKLGDLLKFHVCPTKMKPVRNGKNFDTLLIGEDGFPKQIVCKVTNWDCYMYIFGGQKNPARVTTPPGNCDTGSGYEGVVCDNGIIHQVAEVLVPYEGTQPPKITFIGEGDLDGSKTLQLGFYGPQAGSGFAKWFPREDLSVLDPIKAGKAWIEGGHWTTGHEKTKDDGSAGYTGKK